MTYLFNAPTAFKEEMIEGYTAAYSRYMQRVPGASVVRALEAPKPGKVSSSSAAVPATTRPFADWSGAA